LRNRVENAERNLEGNMLGRRDVDRAITIEVEKDSPQVFS